MNVRVCSTGLVTLAVLVLAGCSVRVPVVTDPQYPTFIYPNANDVTTDETIRGKHRDAWSFLQFGQLTQAERRFAELWNSNPMFYPALTGLGWVSVAKGNLIDAVGYFDGALVSEGGYVSALVGRADALLGLGDRSASLQAYERALEADPSLGRVATIVEEIRFQIVTVRLGEARTAFNEARLDESSLAYREVIAASPESPFLYLELGRVLIEKEQYDAALVELRHAQRLEPQSSEAIVLEGQLLENLGDLDRASEAYERAVAVDQSVVARAALERLKDIQQLADLPSEYGDIAGKRQVTRAEVAAVVGVTLGTLITDVGQGGPTPIFTDIRNHWATEWITAMTRAGLMSIEGRYDFEPNRFIRRAAFAEVVADVLDLIERRNGAGSERSQSDTPRFSDVPVDHLNYVHVTRAVAAGVLMLFDGDRFLPTRPVSGSEVTDAAARLLRLLNSES